MLQSCQACKHKDTCNCGKPKKSVRSDRKSDIEHRIAFGEEADPEQYPWIVYLKTRQPGGGYSACTGAVIGHKHVLTAAHCVHTQAKDKWGRPRPERNVMLRPKNINVYLGNDRRNPMRVASIQKHPTWNIRVLNLTNSHDIAVLELTHSRTDLTPICLPSNSYLGKYVGLKAVAAGFGLPEDPEEHDSSTLLKTYVRMLPNRQCKEWWQTHHSYKYNYNMCSEGWFKPESGIRNGDSGGALQLEEDGRFSSNLSQKHNIHLLYYFSGLC